MILNPGLYFALAHWLLAFTLQLENLFLYSPDSSVPSLLLRQEENLLVCIALGLLTTVLWRRRWGRICALVLFILLSAFLVGDQISYRLFHHHSSLSLTEGQLPQFRLILDSVLAESGQWVILNAAWAGLLITLPFVPAARRRIEKFLGPLPRAFRSRLVLAALAAWIATGFALEGSFSPDELGRHPVVSMASSIIYPPTQAPIAACDPSILAGGSDTLRHGIPKRTVDFEAVRAALRARTHPPNVILVLLESIGSLQILKKGGLDPDLAPGLSRFARNAAIFENIYNTFPATIRTHVPIQTGGETLTWGSVYDDLNSRYLGATLVGELKKRGFRTALFSAQNLTSENMSAFYGRLPFDRVFDPVMQSEVSPEKAKLNSWGIREDAVTGPARRWAVEQNKAGHPFFIQFQTVASHHPYSVPSEFVRRFGDASLLTRYRDTIAYLDQTLTGWLEDLRKDGLLQNTVVAIVGDHGQAFGDRHAGNFTHKNFLYEENIRNFLFLFDERAIQAPILSPQIAYVGDIAPTLLQFASVRGIEASGVFSGESLVSPTYRQKIRFFHKNADPELWGLVDGNFKFISPKTGSGAAELYDLDRDPMEHRNLAQKFPDRIAEYDCLCRNWYLETNRRFLSRLEGREQLAAVRIPETEIKKIGPKFLLFGFQTSDSKTFVPRSTLNPYDPVTVMSDWVPDFKEKTIIYEWASPSGKRDPALFQMKPDWTRSWVAYGGAAPLEEGTWTVRLWDESGKRALTEGQFTVNARADPSPAGRERFLTPFEIKNAPDFKSGETPPIRLSWKPAAPAYNLEAEVTGPEKKTTKISFVGRNPPMQLGFPPDLFQATGVWRIRVLTPTGRKLAETHLRIHP